MSIWEAIVDWFYHLFGYRRVTATSTLETKSHPIGNVPVTLLYAKQGQGFTQDGVGTTNPSGIAQESVYLKKGTYDFRVVYSGTPGQYGPSAASEDNVVV